MAMSLEHPAWGCVRLSDQLLLAVEKANHTAAGIGHPQRAAGFGEDALRALESLADVANGATVDTEVEYRIAAHLATASGSANAT